MPPADDRDFLIAAAAWQETLLQAYRSLHVTIQSILLAVGVGLTVVPLAMSEYPSFAPPVLISTVLLTLIAILHFISSSQFSDVVRARGEDINWWHAELIRNEHSLGPASRYFTRFKIHQQARRTEISHLEAMFLSQAHGTHLTDKQVEHLIGKGLGYTRKVIDEQLFKGIGCIWWSLLLVTWANPIFAAFCR